jgi:23S rRNA (cytosine1962-C5)-methyltransferase
VTKDQGRVILKPRKARPFFGRHPWVLDSAVERVEGDPDDGDVVELVSDRGQWVARGAINSRSRIRVRLYTWNEDEPLDDAFWRRRLEAALAWRTRLLPGEPDGGLRLVNSEADGLSGLVVDRYAEYLVVQVTAHTIAARLDHIVPALAEMVQPRGIVVRAEREMAKLEKMTLAEGTRWGQPPVGPVFINEHGLRYGVELGEGQKTGFFLDQRENRRAAAGYLGGLQVLDLFCYSGSFGICASALGTAADVLGIDSSPKAIALARANAALNEVKNVKFDEGDAFQALATLADVRRRFGAVVLDPPKFARHRQGLDEALRAYHHLNRQAVELLQPGGILVTCSCSGHVTREDFLHLLAEVSGRTGRDIQVLEQRGAAPDHPVAATCLENEYLKCLICRVA